MSSYAVYRLPHANHYTMIEQNDDEPLRMASPEELNDHRGFVLAPFAATQKCPILLIRPDRVETKPTATGNGDAQTTIAGDSPLPVNTLPTSCYHHDFTTFHQAITKGAFRKLVLARCATEYVEGTRAIELFHKACRLYPRLFIALVSTPVSGTWLTATPEILLECNDNQWRTVALAGTMSLDGEQLNGEGEHLSWSVKNIREQRLVASYIADTLKQQGIEFCEEGPRTVRAANLVQLRSDFTFSLNDSDPIHDNKCTRVGHLLAALHPTPAVCGLPKTEAQHFITTHEHSPRRYYSGFMGPLRVEPNATHLYVSLRCMHLSADGCDLYAGGGLLPDSNEQQEWLETEAKMQTMRQLITDKQQLTGV